MKKVSDKRVNKKKETVDQDIFSKPWGGFIQGGGSSCLNPDTFLKDYKKERKDSIEPEELIYPCDHYKYSTLICSKTHPRLSNSLYPKKRVKRNDSIPIRD